MRFIKIIGFLFLLTVCEANAKDLLIVGNDEIIQAIQKEFVEQGMDEETDLEFFGGQTVFQVENAEVAKVLVSSLKTDALQNKFSCKVEIFADGKPYAISEIQGKYYVLGEAYVPTKNINKGEIISENMLKPIALRMNRIKPMNVIEKDKLVNKEAKKTLKEGKIVNNRDIGSKILIKKNDIITAVYKTDKMQITTKVQALSDGSKGDKIELVNTKSKKILFGEVLDADTVEIEQ